MKDSWKELKKDLEKKLIKAGLSFSLESSWELLKEYLLALEKVAYKLNLTAIKDTKERLLGPFFEAIFLAYHLPPNIEVADLGSGAGIPGLVVKIVRPDISILLLEAFPPRVDFMNSFIKLYSLKGIKALTCHIGREMPKISVPVVLARGYGSVVKFTQHAHHLLLTPGKAFYLWRKDVEPWGEGKEALFLSQKVKNSEMSSILLCWDKLRRPQ